MGKWQEIRTVSGRLLGRIDAERRLLEIVRNGDQALIDLDVYLQSSDAAQGGIHLPAAPGPSEVKR